VGGRVGRVRRGRAFVDTHRRRAPSGCRRPPAVMTGWGRRWSWGGGGGGAPCHAAAAPTSTGTCLAGDERRVRVRLHRGTGRVQAEQGCLRGRGSDGPRKCANLHGTSDSRRFNPHANDRTCTHDECSHHGRGETPWEEEQRDLNSPRCRPIRLAYQTAVTAIIANPDCMLHQWLPSTARSDLALNEADDTSNAHTSVLRLHALRWTHLGCHLGVQ
jgi:hypothetical protein